MHCHGTAVGDRYQNQSGKAVCLTCPKGHYCVGDVAADGTGTIQPTQCPGGSYGPMQGIPGAYGLEWELTAGPENLAGLTGDVAELKKERG